eukprot:gene7862-9679_t
MSLCHSTSFSHLVPLLHLYKKYDPNNVIITGFASKVPGISQVEQYLFDFANNIDTLVLPDQISQILKDKYATHLLGISTCNEFSKYFEQLSILALMQTQDHPLLQHHILSFYELAATIVTNNQLPFTIIPSIHLCRRIYLSCHTISISRITGIISLYSREFSLLKDEYLQNQLIEIIELKLSISNHNENLQIVNNCILELGSNLWKGQVQTPNDKSTRQQQQQQQSNLNDSDSGKEKQVLKESITLIDNSLSVSNSIAFLNFSMDYKNSNNKEDYLDYLLKIGHTGLYNFLKKYMKQ